MEPFVGQIMMFGGNFAPRGWAFCNGQLLSIQSNTALFAILGTTYGGNGQTTFGLPNLQGRVPMHAGTGPGLPPVALGQMAGSPTHTLTVAEMPSHNHTMHGELAPADKPTPQGNMLGLTPNTPIYTAPVPAQDRTFAATSIGMAGGNQPFDLHSPYLAVNFIIALVGIFPSRN
ncbi:tail fiber protein [Sphingomonas sp. ST-64]|uniref:Tail fiber protein n=1 Tax=Sphingomonas plantiphila TaxID=3163295 RepID=A0ABW8YHB1_9SPHN